MEKDELAQEQAQLWNGSAGQAWAGLQALLDHMYAPFEALLAGAALGSERQVLDVGCGTGATTLAIARRLGEQGACLGVDISQPMIEVANARARQEDARAAFVCADAGTYPFAPGSVDLVVSRFGLMFFADPVAAFANLRRAAQPDGRLDAIVWRGLDENPFMTAAERAARDLLPFPQRDPDAPGQFAFARRERVERILGESGWAGVAIDPLDVPCSFPARELLPYLTQMGPVGRVLAQADEPTRDAVLARVRPAFDPFIDGETVRFVAACWRVRAAAGGA